MSADSTVRAKIPSGGSTDSGSVRASGLRLVGVTKRLGGRRVIDDVNLEVAAGSLLGLLGPSGCGKTTTLRMIGGFLRPDEGRIEIDSEDVTALGPERRPTAMVFQSYALWPHMTVERNVAFGLKLRRLPKSDIRERVMGALELVNIPHLAGRYPAQISGGEQQRVALARALVLEPKVLLLDEPLSNLDAKLRVQVREDIRAIQQRVGITAVFVTHDQDEALSISDRVAVMHEGTVAQIGEPMEVYAQPATMFVGGFVGAMNRIPGSLSSGGVNLGPQGGRMVWAGRVPGRVAGIVQDAATELCVRPEDIQVVPRALGSAGARVVRTVTRGHFKEVVCDQGGVELRAFVAPSVPIGDIVELRVRRLLVYRGEKLIDVVEAE